MINRPNDQERIEHMLDAIRKILHYTEDVGEVAFLKNEMMQDAVFKNFEIIGEASYHISKDLKTRYPIIEWRKIEGLRHVLVHDYYKINPEILWNTKENFIEDLAVNLEELTSEEFEK